MQTPTERHGDIHNVAVRVQTPDGAEGTGLVWATTEAKAGVIQQMVVALAPLVLGVDGLAPGSVAARLRRYTDNIGRSGIATVAISAIDMALWDLLGKVAGLPVWRMLGGVHAQVPTYASGLFLLDSREAIVDEAEGLVNDGFDAIKMRVGLADWREDLARVESVRESIGDDIALAVDAAQAWDPATALRMARELAPFGLAWLEDPVAYHALDTLRRLRDHASMPIAAGERLYALDEFARLIHRDSVDVVLADLGRCGGISGWSRVAALCEASAVTLTPHALPEVGAQVMAGTGGEGRVEHLPWWGDVLDSDARPHRGVIRLPESPGLGLRLRDDAVVATQEIR